MGAQCLQLRECDIQKTCIDYLRVMRWYVLDFSRHDCPDLSGISDIMAMKRGRYLWIEFKRPGNKQQANQIEFMNNIRSHDGEYILIYSIDELMEFLKDDTLQGEMF